MSQDLLAKEQEFHRLNKELEQRTRDLMKEIDSVINSRRDEVNFYAKENCERYSEFPPNEKAKKQRENVEPVTEESNSKPTASKGENSLMSKATFNVFKAKIEMLQGELQTMRLEYKKKCDYCKELELEEKKLEETKVKFQNEIESLKDVVTKTESAKINFQCQSQVLSAENLALKKDIDGFNKQIKSLNQRLNNYETRLNRSSESNEKLRNTLKCSHIDEKELKNQIRTLQEDKRLAIKNLERQRTELVQAFKKQMLLIDNLKKQNACLTASGRLVFTEEDFSKLLDGKPGYL